MLASDIETPNKVIKNRSSSKSAESGGFVLWQMNPDMWYVELALGGSKVHAGSNGKLVWRHTPWLGAHAAKGPVRPLRRALQVSGLLPDPVLICLVKMSYPFCLLYVKLCRNSYFHSLGMIISEYFASF